MTTFTMYPFTPGTMTPEIAEELSRMEGNDITHVLYAIRRMTTNQEILDMIQSYFDKWQGVPADAAEALVELRKRSVASGETSGRDVLRISRALERLAADGFTKLVLRNPETDEEKTMMIPRGGAR